MYIYSNLSNINQFLNFVAKMFVYLYLSSIELALAKHNNADLTRKINTPGVLTVIGYWLVSAKVSVPGILPSVSIPGRIDMSMILANEITT